MRQTYCTVADVNIRATDEGQTAWSGLDDIVKKRIIFEATDDLKAAHQMPDEGGIPWGFSLLREAAETRCMYLARVLSLKGVRERAEYLGADSINDGILQMSSISSGGLDPATKSQLAAVIKAIGCQEFERG